MRKSATYELKKSATRNTNSVKKLRFLKEKRNGGMRNSMNPTETNRSTSRKRLSGPEAQHELTLHPYINNEEGMVTNPKTPVKRAREQT